MCTRRPHADEPAEKGGHIVPVGDTFEHELSVDCWCKPEEHAEHEGLYVHQRHDGAEYAIKH